MRSVALLLLATVGWVQAQSPTGQISGTVLDPTGARVGGSQVSALQLNTGRTLTAAADPQGAYRFSVLPAGPYRLQASAPDLSGLPREVRLEVGRSLEVELRVEPEAFEQNIEVSDSTPLINPNSSEVGFAINRERIAQLPLNQRDFLRLALLAGGVQPPAPGSELSTQNDTGLNVNGAREASNNYLLDGVDNNDLYINRLVVSPPLDSVSEFRLHSSNYQAEFGRSGGAQVNVVSRSGTNELHGSAYEFLRNDSLDATNFFDPAGEPIPKFQRNQFGVSLGGPIRAERAFFFAGYEGTRVRDAVTRTARVPTAAERAGDFSASPDAIIDPFTQQPFPGNRIPVERLDPAGLQLASQWPDPNRADPLQNLVTTPVGSALVNQFYGRVDLYASEADSLYLRYNFSHDRAFNPFGDGGGNVPGFGVFVLDRGRNFAASHTHVFSPRLVSEFRFGYNRLEREVRQQNSGVDFASALGIPGLSSDPDFLGAPALNTPGFDNLGDDTALPILRNDSTYHLVENFTWTRSGHRLKFGGEWRHVRVNGIQGLFGRGQFNFLGAFTANPVGDLLLGFPSFTIQTTVDNPFRQRASAWNLYVQDDWRLAPRLSLNLGLRYERNQPAVDARDRFVYFDPDRAELVPAGQGPGGRAGYRSDNNNFAPRVGLSWRPGASETVIRAAYGLFFDVTVLEANSGLYFNPPFFDLRLFFPSQSRLLTLSDPFPTGAGFTPLASVNSIDPNFRTGYAQHWNVGAERTLPGGILLRASYLGSKGTKLLRRRDTNQPGPGAGDIDPRRPIGGFANVVLFESAASSIYHSGQIVAERRFAKQLTFSFSYTLSKSIDDMSAFLNSSGDQGFAQDSQNFRAERGLSSFDQRHRAVFNLTYAVPFRHPFVRNWEFHTIGSYGSGRPFTPALSVDNSNTGNSGSIFGQDRPNLIGDPEAGGSTPERFFDTAAFALPAEFTFGNAGRNILIGPAGATLDAAVVRSFELGDSTRLALRFEAFNLTNRTNFDLPERFADQATFGRILTAGAARQMQLGLRISF